jgi:hypothetical protein
VSFVAIERGAVELTVAIPPKIVSRFDEGGPSRSISIAVGGQAIATEVPQTVDERLLKLRWEDMDASLVAIVQQLLDGSGPVTVLTHAAATPATCMFGPRSEQKITPLAAPSYPETLADGTAQLAQRKRCSVELTLYRI